MEITFTANVKQPRVVELDTSDKQAAEQMAVNALLRHVEFGSFDFQHDILASRNPVTLDDHIINMCRKYEVNPYNKEDRVSFFRAIFSQTEGEESESFITAYRDYINGHR